MNASFLGGDHAILPSFIASKNDRKRLGAGAVVRRLGYLLEHYSLADTSRLESLRGTLTASYQRLDPLLPAAGAFLSCWRLQLSVTSDELDAVRLG